MCSNKITIIREKKTCVFNSKKIVSECPKTIYKFYSLDRGICRDEIRELNNKKFEALKNKKVWLSHFTNMNDPFEYCGIQSIDIDYNSETGAMYRGLEKVKGQLFFSSFTKNLNNASMWAYYANEYNGFCVSYSVEENINNPKEIKYANFSKNFSNEQYQSICQKDENAVYNLIELKNRFIIKNKYWEHEEEYRVFDSEPNAIKRYSNENGFLRNLSEFGLSINAIYIGLKCSKENETVLISIAKELNVKSYFMIKDENKMTFEFQEIKMK